MISDFEFSDIFGFSMLVGKHWQTAGPESEVGSPETTKLRRILKFSGAISVQRKTKRMKITGSTYLMPYLQI